MLNIQTKNKKLLIIGLSSAVAAILIWVTSVNNVDFVSYYAFISWFIGAFLIGFLSGTLFQNDRLFAAILVLAGFFLALLIRIVYDVYQDPTSNNLAGIAFIIAGIYVFPPALLGSFLGSFFRKRWS